MSGDMHSNSENGKQLNPGSSNGMPILRIGLIENRDTIEFKSTGRFSVLNDQGLPILKEVTSSAKWRIKVTLRQPAKFVYTIILGKFLDPRDAHELEYTFIEKGIGTSIKTRGGKLYHDDLIVNDNTQFWVVIDELKSEREALEFAQRSLSHFSYQIIKEKVNEPHAMLELFDSEFEKLGEAENIIRIVPDSTEVFTYIYDSGGENEPQHYFGKHRTLKGPLEFRSTSDGKVLIICESPLEKYVESIVALEMKSEFPKELIKAQAVAIRSKTIASLGVRHPDDTYHLCSSPHCQPFTGFRQIPEVIAKSVNETAGVVLRNQREVIDANCTLVCGGHTEAFHNLSPEEANDPYPPIFDGEELAETAFQNDLTAAENLKNWVWTEPDVYCNMAYLHDENQIIMQLRRYFRWQISYSRQELEEIITTNIGSNVGFLYDIIPIRYGVSGRILELEILASNKNLVLNGEQNIRKILAPDGLSSSCFTIERQFDEDGFPTQFIFKGAGHGHGVGLCQAGGLTMAHQGKDYTEILTHYFKNVNLKKIY